MSLEQNRQSDITEIDSNADSALTGSSPIQSSSYSLNRFLQEPVADSKDLTPVSSAEAAHIDTTKIALREQRMQDQSAGVGANPGAAPPVVRRPRILMMGQRRYGSA
jgi:hypothetical protein